MPIKTPGEKNGHTTISFYATFFRLMHLKNMHFMHFSCLERQSFINLFSVKEYKGHHVHTGGRGDPAFLGRKYVLI
jgi:hypothetical protein